MTHRVAVIGGGISGLAAAYFLRRPGCEVTVLEKSAQIGGHLRVSDAAGFPVDEGAESLLNRRPEAVALARDVGLGDDIVYPAQASAQIFSDGALHRLPGRTVMGVPADPDALSGLFTADEIAVVRAERQRPGMPLREDVGIGAVVRQRFGAAVADRLVEPLLAGVYAGRADDLSLHATVPALGAAAQSSSSLLDAAATVADQARGAMSRPVFAGIRGGVGRLPGAVAHASGATIRLRTTARGITRVADGGFIVETGPAPSPEHLRFDAVIVATPPTAAARLLAGIAPEAASPLNSVEQASVAIVTLALPRTAFPTVPESSGFLIPPAEGRRTKAVTLSSIKWPWLGEQAGDVVILRASLGRIGEVETLQHSDEELIDVVLADLGTVLGAKGEPVDRRVTRWGGALPQYAVGHVERMAKVRAAVAAVPGLAVCGATYDGVGVAACVASAERAAEQVMASLGSSE